MTGVDSVDVIMKVYDLYGGRFEWTLEGWYGYYRCIRGGRYNQGGSYAPATRSNFIPIEYSANISSRLALCIN